MVGDSAGGGRSRAGLIVGSVFGALPDHLGAGLAQGPVALEQPPQLVVGESRDEDGEACSASLVEGSEGVATSLGDAHEDDPAILEVVDPLDEPALLHAVDDSGRAGDGHVERLGEAAHLEGAVRVEEDQDVEMRKADRTLVPALERGDELSRMPRAELVDRLPDEGTL